MTDEIRNSTGMNGSIDPPDNGSKQPNEVISLIAHELKNPIASIRGYAELLLPGFHVAKSVKLENLDKTPTLGEITGVLNQYYMNLQPK